MSHTYKISRWSNELSFDDIPGGCVAKAKEQLFNILGAIFMSVRHPSSEAATKALTAFGANGPSSIFATGHAVQPDVAAFVNSYNAQLFEFEDWVNASHAGAAVVPTAIAVGEAADSSGAELLTAIVIGNEMAGRTGRAILNGAYVGNSLPNHQVDAALTAGKLLGLGVRELQSALALSCFMAMESCPPGFITDAKALINGIPASHGIRSALMAKHGVVGNEDMIEHSAGYLATVSEVVDLDALTRDLGSDWVLPTLRSKAYPICGYNISAIEAGRRCVQDNDISWEDIEEVVVFAPASTLLAGTRYHSLKPDVFAQIEAGTATHMPLLFDVPYPLAVALIFGDLVPEHFTQKYISDRSVRALASKISLRVDNELNKAYYNEFKFGSRVTITLKSGSTYETLVEEMPGSPTTPFDVRSKFLRGLTPVVGQEKAEHVAAIIDDLENCRARDLGHALRG